MAARAFDPPPVEHGVPTCAFKKGFLNITAQYGNEVMKDVYDQASNKSDELIHLIQKWTVNLKKLLESDEKNIDKQKVENAVNLYSAQVEEYLELGPGYTLLKFPKPPNIPEQTTVIPPEPPKRSARELFVEFPIMMDSDLRSTYGSIKAMFLEGWKAIVSYFEIILSQFREQLLNRKITTAYKKSVNIITKCSDLIRKYVSNETWNRFDQCINNVIRVPGSSGSTPLSQFCKSRN